MSVEIAYAEGMLSVWMYGQLPAKRSTRVAPDEVSVVTRMSPLESRPALGDQIVPLAPPPPLASCLG
jgi:hypothetical protein